MVIRNNTQTFTDVEKKERKERMEGKRKTKGKKENSP